MTRLANKPKITILGSMSGTSCDALDSVTIEITPFSIKKLSAFSSPIPNHMRRAVYRFDEQNRKVSIKSLLELNRDYSTWAAKALTKGIQNSNQRKPDLISIHGQTIGHFPSQRGVGTTLQLCDPTIISYESGLTVASNFRSGDLASGGQGAPLAPLFHQLLAHSSKTKHQIFLNLGGISNVSVITGNRLITSFDTGPANILIDQATQIFTKGKKKYDADGKIAKIGKADFKAVKKLMRDPYFRKSPPKSTGRDAFTMVRLRRHTRSRAADLIATATEFTAYSVAAQIKKHGFSTKTTPRFDLIVSGGGAKNRYLLQRIGHFLPEAKIFTSQQRGVDPQDVEAMAFGYFGFLSLLGHSLGGSWTGGTTNAPGGEILPGKNWLHLLEKIRPFLKMGQSQMNHIEFDY